MEIGLELQTSSILTRSWTRNSCRQTEMSTFTLKSAHPDFQRNFLHSGKIGICNMLKQKTPNCTEELLMSFSKWATPPFLFTLPYFLHYCLKLPTTKNRPTLPPKLFLEMVHCSPFVQLELPAAKNQPTLLRPKMIVRSGATFILRWSCFLRTKTYLMV